MTSAVHAVSSGSAILGWLLLLVAVVWSGRSIDSTDGSDMAVSARPDWKWWLLLGGALLAFRWPLIWLPHEIHPDESQLIAGAITLRHDPLFWRSVDGNTAGPLDFYPLMAAGFVTPPAGYAAARIVAVILIAGMLAALGESIACVASRATARVTVLPLLAFEAFTTNAEFIHYSTELMPGFILAAAFYFVVRQSNRPAPGVLWAAALLLGSVPFSKLQGLPMAGVLWLYLAVGELRTRRQSSLVPLTIGLFLPAIVAAVVASVTGQAANLLIPYLLNNFAYVQRTQHPAGEVLLYQWNMAVNTGYLALLLAGSALWLGCALVLTRQATSRVGRLQLAAVLLFATAVGCIVTPGRNYGHYMNFLILPLGCILGGTLASVLQANVHSTTRRLRLLSAGFLLCTVLPQMALRASPRPDPYESANFASTRASESELVRILRATSRPQEPLGIWGWRNSLYADTGLRQATREAHNEAQLLPGTWQDYFLGRYLADIRASAPPVFVDTTGPNNFRFTDRNFGHEVFPQLQVWVRRNYTFLCEVDAARVYVRNDRLAVAQHVWQGRPALP